MTHLIFGTNNGNKVVEIQGLIPNNYVIKSLADLQFKIDVPETQNTIEGNAIQKSEFIYCYTKSPTFSEDTGLEVHAINNQPGVHSARFAGSTKNDAKNIDKLLRLLEGESNRNARFRTVLSFTTKEGTVTFEGILEGRISESPSGSNGFGYDPIFIPKGTSKTLAEHSFEEKITMSHRTLAIQKFLSYLK